MRDYKLRKKVYNDYATKEDLENAGGGGVSSLVCRILNGTPQQNTRLDTKWSVINQAFVTGRAVIIRADTETHSIWARIVTTFASSTANEFAVLAYGQEGQVITLETDRVDGYPHLSEE